MLKHGTPSRMVRIGNLPELRTQARERFTREEARKYLPEFRSRLGAAVGRREGPSSGGARLTTGYVAVKRLCVTKFLVTGF